MFVYLDHAATTPVCAEAAQAALEEMTAAFGNPSARHAFGQQAAQRLEERRAVVAEAQMCIRDSHPSLCAGGVYPAQQALRRVGELYPLSLIHI